MEKHIGLVKWFHDNVKNTNIGFIHHAILGDLFFHEKSIEQGQEINAFKENEVVIFVSKVSKKYADKLEAVQVKLLSSENNLNYLFKNLFSTFSATERYYPIQKAIYTRIEHLLKTTDDKSITDKLFNIYQDHVNSYLLSTEKLQYIFLKRLLNVCKDFFPEKYENTYKNIELKISVEIAHQLWLEKYTDICQIDYIAELILTANKSTQREIFNRCTEEDKLNIFFKVFDKYKDIGTGLKLEQIKSILELSKQFASELYEHILKRMLRICSPYQKLKLWLEDYHQELYFDEYKMFTIMLNPDDQKKFVKKTLKYIHEGKVNISVEQLTSINVVSYDSSKSIENTDNIKLDYSTSIILNTILELNNQQAIETRKQQNEAKFRIFDLILNQIKEPSDILEIKGYFDECEGRCLSVSINEIKNEEGEIINRSIEYPRNKYKKSKTPTICDGRKFLDKEGNPVLDEQYKLEYWWCANQKCYKPSRETHSSDEWKKYTLLDFLTILKIDFIEKDFEMYLNVINKANRFLKHLKCRECNHILRPIGQANYAFYGVNTFNCINEHCKEKENSIYLTHCLNGRCDHDIDSRDSARCKPYGVDSEKYGWYICNYCHSCCSTNAIKARISNMESRRQEYNGHTEGHRDLGVISCDKCGEAMEENKVNIDEFNKALDWFVKNKNNSKYITKSGISKNNKNWFLFAKADMPIEKYNSKLNNLLVLGFSIPNIDENRIVQLISEPIDFKKHNSEILVCKNCKNTLDLSIDREKSIAIKYFHNVRYVIG